jgi:hypothetical protein
MPKKNEYHIKIHSRIRLIFAMTLILCSTSIMIKQYLPKIENQFVSFVIFAIVFAISFYIASFFATAKIMIILTEDSILHFWKRRFFLNWEKDIKNPLEIVDNYAFKSDRTCDTIIVNLSNKMKYKIEKLNIFPMNDDFRRLENDFLKRSRSTIK